MSIGQVGMSRSSGQCQDDQTWARLMGGYISRLSAHGCGEFNHGFKRLAFAERTVERIDDLDAKIRRACGWSVKPVDGLLPDDEFYSLLQRRTFPIAADVRRPEELEFSVLPDLFHDSLGHLPLLTNDLYGEFLRTYSAVALKFLGNGLALRSLARVYWYTIETGLVMEAGATKILGAAIITSAAECEAVYGGRIELRPFDFAQVFASGYDSFKLQKQYFVLESFETLAGISETLEAALTEYLADVSLV
ncbi:hypothetical protein [Burkholderia sp. MSMB175]|nr:hypothetical protein [Burkholderia sp. MSMB175]